MKILVLYYCFDDMIFIMTYGFLNGIAIEWGDACPLIMMIYDL